MIRRFDRSLQTNTRAEPARPDGRRRRVGALADRQVGDEALAGEELLRLLEAQVVRRDDQVRGGQVVVRQPLAALTNRLRHEPEQAVEALLVARLDGLSGLGVELVERLDDVVTDPELPVAAQEPGDHCPISFFSPPPPPAPSSAFIFASSSSTCDCEESWASSRSSACRARSSRPAATAWRACVSSLTTLCSSCSFCIWRRFFAVTTSATPRFTFWSSWSCCSYE